MFAELLRKEKYSQFSCKQVMNNNYTEAETFGSPAKDS